MISTKPALGFTLQRLAWKLLFGLLGLVAFSLLVLLMLPYVVSLDSVKGQIVAQVEAALQRKVEVGAMRLQILSGPGASLEDLLVYNPPGWQQPYFIKAGALSVKVAWRPLLQSRIEITKMLLNDGEIIIERDAQGRMNFADLAASKPKAAQILPAQVHRPTNGGGAQPGIHLLADLLVSAVALHNMQITFVDRSVVPGKETITVVSNFQLNLHDVALGTPIPIDMTATMLTNGHQNIRLHGHVGPIPTSLAVERTPIDIHLRATDVLLDKLTPYLGAEFPLAQGRFGGDFKVKGSIDSRLRIHGTLSLADAMVSDRIARNASTALPKLTSAQDITLDLPTGRAELRDVQINLSSLQATIQGVVHHFTTTPQFDLQLTTNTFAPGELLTQLSMLGAMLPTPTELRGNIQLQATFIGSPHDLRSDAQVDLTQIVWRSGSFSGGGQGSGGILLETDTTNVKLVTHVVNAGPPRVYMDIRAQRLVFDHQGANAPAPTPDIEPRPTTQMAPSQPMLPPVTFSGNVSIAEGRIKNLNFQQMTADIDLLKGLLNTKQRMRVYGGSYQGTMQIDLTQSEPPYMLDAKVADLDIGHAVSELTSVKNVLLGVLDSDMRLSGQGFAWEVINKTLSGDGHVKIAEAKFTTFDLIPKLARVLQHVGGVAGVTIPSGWEHNSFRAIEGDWHLHQGKLFTDHLRLKGEGMEALLKGYVGLDQSIDYEGNFFLPAKWITLRGAPTILRQDEAGRVVLPFAVKGTVTAPRIAFNEQALVDLVEEALANKVRKQLGDKIEGVFGKPSASDQQSQESDTAGQETGNQPKRQNLPGKILKELFRR